MMGFFLPVLVKARRAKPLLGEDLAELEPHLWPLLAEPDINAQEYAVADVEPKAEAR
jgi:hypothetical protein